jgi:hypothetical protein
MTGPPEKFASLIRTDGVRWGAIVKASGVRLTEPPPFSISSLKAHPCPRPSQTSSATSSACLRDVVAPGRQFQPAILADVAGRRGALHGRIKALRPRMKLAGPALTVEVRPGDNLMIHAAMAMANPATCWSSTARATRPRRSWARS